MEYQGVFMKKGDLVLVAVALDGLDPDRFPDSLSEQFARNPPHAGFGLGEHRCVGSHLAQPELRIFLEEWLDRIGEFTLEPRESALRRIGADIAINYCEREDWMVGSREDFAAMLHAIAHNALHPVIGDRFAFADLPSALRYLAAGKHIDKIVIEHDFH
jgi:hypothetical protein